jgi:hypothetical protein
MKQEELDLITETVTGYPVRNLRWKKMDNIITGQVKCPVIGKENFNDGYISGTWKRNGSPTNIIRGLDDLRLKINLEVTI